MLTMCWRQRFWTWQILNGATWMPCCICYGTCKRKCTNWKTECHRTFKRDWPKGLRLRGRSISRTSEPLRPAEPSKEAWQMPIQSCCRLEFVVNSLFPDVEEATRKTVRKQLRMKRRWNKHNIHLICIPLLCILPWGQDESNLNLTSTKHAVLGSHTPNMQNVQNCEKWGTPFKPAIVIEILLMVQKSHSQPPGMLLKPCKSWDKLPTSTGDFTGFLNHQHYHSLELWVHGM